jgi:hypothetical protein
MEFPLLNALVLAALIVFASPLATPGATPAELVRDYREGLIFVEGTRGQGSGFIIEQKGQKYLFTNAHVMAGVRGPSFNLLDRTPIRVGTAQAAVGHDLVALSVISGGTALPSVESVDQEAALGDAVVVLGNAEGAGVVNLLQGSIVGIGPTLIEVDAPFVPGNSGSPIIQMRTGKVLGIATYMTVRRVGGREERVRRFGYRLDSVQQWQNVNWKRFYAEADAVDQIEKTTAEFIALLDDISKNGRPTRVYSAPSIRSAVESFANSLKQGLGRADAANYAERFLTTLRTASIRDVREAQASVGYDFFKRRLETEAREREEVTNVFEQAAKRPRR